MKLHTGLHPRNWHWGAWVVLVVLAVLVLVLTHRPTVGFAQEAQQEPTAPSGDTVAPPPSETTAPAPAAGNGYVAEIVDSSYTVGPAEFFALDLPMEASGARAVHLFGTVTTHGRKDIMVRLFKASDYDRWLKQKSGRKPQAFWSSPRSGNLTLDQDLPPYPVVLLLDNGYSIRTPKKVTCQLQMRYLRDGETMTSQAGGVAAKPATPPSDDNLPAPRANTEEEMPAPPPPPPSGY
jgi:hypothetical protein